MTAGDENAIVAVAVLGDDVRRRLYAFVRAGAAGARRVGRPRKVYEPAEAVVQVSIPARRHQVLAEILAQAIVDEDAHGSAKAAAMRAAHERGFAAAAAARWGRVGAGRALTMAEDILSDLGFEPDWCRPNPPA